MFRRHRPSASQSVVRAADCIYHGEPYPSAGERMVISGVDVVFLFSQGDLPSTWSAVVHHIRECTGEPADQRVLRNILGTMLAMMQGKFAIFASRINAPANAEKALGLLCQGHDEVATYRELFRGASEGVAFEFEMTKIASLLASPRSHAARAQAGWPEPDVWQGDLSVFRLA